MAKQIHQLAGLTGNIANGDMFAVDTGTVTRKFTYGSLAEAVVGQYNGSTVGGKAQTIKAAIDAIAGVLSDAEIRKIFAGNVIVAPASGAGEIGGLMIYGKSVQDGTPTPSVPVDIVTAGDSGTLTMVSAGKNLAYMTRGSINYATGAEEVNNQATRTGFIPVMGPRLYCTKSTAFASGSAYSLNARCYAADQSYIGTARVMDGEVLESYVTLQYNTPLNQAAYIRFVQFYPDSTTTPEDINLMIAFGDTSSVSYPEYVRASSISAAIDTTPNGLPGIPVASGGNYTDTNGQKWICDTIDLEAGVRTKRVGVATLDGSDDEGWILSQNLNYMYGFSGDYGTSIGLVVDRSNAFPHMTTWTIEREIDTYVGNNVQVGESYISGGAKLWLRTNYSTIETFKAALADHPMTFVFPLVVPVTNQLTQAQITALKTLKSFDGSTVLFTTDDAQPNLRAKIFVNAGAYI